MRVPLPRATRPRHLSEQLLPSSLAPAVPEQVPAAGGRREPLDASGHRAQGRVTLTGSFNVTPRAATFTFLVIPAGPSSEGRGAEDRSDAAAAAFLAGEEQGCVGTGGVQGSGATGWVHHHGAGPSPRDLGHGRGGCADRSAGAPHGQGTAWCSGPHLTHVSLAFVVFK